MTADLEMRRETRAGNAILRVVGTLTMAGARDFEAAYRPWLLQAGIRVICVDLTRAELPGGAAQGMLAVLRHRAAVVAKEVMVAYRGSGRGTGSAVGYPGAWEASAEAAALRRHHLLTIGQDYI
jgi:anti-anti-sigma regulatory factor